MMRLQAANWEDRWAEWAFVRDMPADENGFLNEWHGIGFKSFQATALPAMIDYAAGLHLPDGYVPETFMFLWKDEKIVGQFRLRHHLCESLRTGAGHIGYYISPEFRGKGYGTQGLQLMLRFAKNVVPEDEIYLRVNKNNPASLRVMLKNGGYIHHEDDFRYYVRIKKSMLI